MPTFEFLDADQAIKKIEYLKRNKKRSIVCIINFDEDTEERKTVNYDESCRLIECANTIVHNDDDFIPHLELYSTRQEDIRNIIGEGVMHDLYIAGSKK